MKLITVVGARPQFIKAAAVSAALSESSTIHEMLVHTGQHFDDNMSAVFFNQLGIPQPAYNLGIGNKSHGEMTGAQLIALEKVFLQEQPDWVMVYGDTNSTLAAALAASKLKIPVAHVEAGLRSFNRDMPEEINRVLTDRISNLLLAPTEQAIRNLIKEGVPEDWCYNVGDVMYDAALMFAALSRDKSKILADLNLEAHEYILLTVHRAENTDCPVRLKAILSALKELSETVQIVWPIHPRTRKQIRTWGLEEEIGAQIRLIDPLGYLDMVMLEQHAVCIVTDSGGVQKEAFFYQIPCVTLRDETEWTELVDSGWNRLVSPGRGDVAAEGIRAAIGSQGVPIHPYGDGHASDRIVSLLIEKGAERRRKGNECR